MPASPEFEYRIWQHGSEWHWQVATIGKRVVASGVAENSVAARGAAMRHCLDSSDNHSN